MRVLCSNGIFCEVAPDVFANNRVSAALIQNEPLRAYMLHLSVCTLLTMTAPGNLLITPIQIEAVR